MAVSKLWKVTERLGQIIDYAVNPEKTLKGNTTYSDDDYMALKDVLAYAKDEEKTEQELFCDGIHCSVVDARNQFINIKREFGKQNGIQAYHGYLSFKEQNISPELAHRIGVEFANEVWGKRFQVVVTTHLNTKHLHCHFVINSISFVDGKRLQNEEKAWIKFRHIADRICEKYGLYYNPTPNRSKGSSYYYNKDKAGIPTRYSILKQAIDEALEHSTSVWEFDNALTKMGYKHSLSNSRKYWTIIPKGYKKPVRLKALGEDYTEDAIRKRLMENRQKNITRFDGRMYKPKQYNLPTRGEFILKNKTGFQRLYLYYCYKLGYLPKYKKQNNARLHYLLREDLLKVEQITQEVRLLGRENLSTAEQLFSYKHKVESEIKALTDDRTHLRKKVRRNLSDDELSKVKGEIKDTTEKLRKLRKELKLCDGIAERSKVMEQNLEQVRADEEKSHRKERKPYEQWR